MNAFKLLNTEQLILIDKFGADGKIFLCRIIVLIVISVVNRISIISPVSSHKLKAVLGILYRKHRSVEFCKAAVVS